jgi:hypothetical protein
MAPSHPFAQMQRVQVECLRGEPMITVSAGVNAPLAAASLSWLAKYTGEPPNVVREEPPDQMAAALAQTDKAISFMTEHRALLARSEGLEYRPLTPAPVIEYGVAYLCDNSSPTLAHLLETIDDVVPPMPADLPPSVELLHPPGRRGKVMA